jgi:AcrR family transcriptional regulator
MEKRPSRAKRVQLAEVVRTLPRRGHDLTRQTVRESQRWRLLEAMTEVLAKKGYTDTSVADVIAVAGVSRKTFYEYFTDKEDCFLTAYDVISERLVQALIAIGQKLPDGPARRRAQISAFLRALSRDVLSARVFMVDVLGAGARALKRRERVNGLFTDAVLGTVKIDPVSRAAIIGGINTVAASELLAGRGESLTAFENALCEFTESSLRR